MAKVRKVRVSKKDAKRLLLDLSSKGNEFLGGTYTIREHLRYKGFDSDIRVNDVDLFIHKPDKSQWSALNSIAEKYFINLDDRDYNGRNDILSVIRIHDGENEYNIIFIDEDIPIVKWVFGTPNNVWCSAYDMDKLIKDKKDKGDNPALVRYLIDNFKKEEKTKMKEEIYVTRSGEEVEKISDTKFKLPDGTEFSNNQGLTISFGFPQSVSKEIQDRYKDDYKVTGVSFNLPNGRGAHLLDVFELIKKRVDEGKLGVIEQEKEVAPKEKKKCLVISPIGKVTMNYESLSEIVNSFMHAKKNGLSWAFADEETNKGVILCNEDLANTSIIFDEEL